jgi:hypothetical protein
LQLSAYRRRRSSSSSSSRRVSSFGHGYAARGVLLLLLGIWLGGILMVTLGFPQSFRAIDSVMTGPPPEAAKIIQTIGPATTRLLLRYQISEANRLILSLWGWTQLALAASVFLLVLFGTSASRWVVGVALGMLILSLLMNVVMVPRLGEISRDLEFTPGSSTQKDSDRFRLLHRGFSAFEGAIVLLGAGLLAGFFMADEIRSRSGALPGDSGLE